jgi:hypothetical protein
MTFLAAEAADLGNGHALDAFGTECVFNLFQFEVSDNRLDLFHGNSPGTGIKCIR